MRDKKDPASTKKRKKLTLSEESLRLMKLEDDQLDRVFGGGIPRDPSTTPWGHPKCGGGDGGGG